MRCLSALWLVTVVPATSGLKTSPALEAFQPDFIACDIEEQCASPPARSYFVGKLLEHGCTQARALAAAGRAPTILHVGADGLQGSARWVDVPLYSEVLSRLGISPGLIKFAFVEPIKGKSATFWMNARRLPVNLSQVQLVNAMVDGHCEKTHETMYKISDLAERDFHFDTHLSDGWVSTNPHFPWNAMEYWVKHGLGVRCPGVQGGQHCSAGMRNLFYAENRSAYLEKVLVRCLTLKDLMVEVGVLPQDVALLTVDAEGRDAHILGEALDIPGFKPGFVMFEGDRSQTSTGLAAGLRARGYSVGLKPGAVGHGGDNSNIIAVLQAGGTVGA